MDFNQEPESPKKQTRRASIMARKITQRLTGNVNSFFVDREFREENLDKALNLLIYGRYIGKICKQGKFIHDVLFYILEGDHRILQWISNKKKYNETRIDLTNVKLICEKPTIIRRNLTDDEEELILVIQHGSNHELVLLFDDKDKKQLWWQGLQHFVKLAQNQQNKAKNGFFDIAKELWVKADKDGNKILDDKEIQNILKELHIGVNQQTLSNLIKAYYKNLNGAIDFNEFIQLVKQLLTKEELRPLFNKYCQVRADKQDDSLPQMKNFELKEFLKNEQYEDIDLDEVHELIDYFKEDVSKKQTDYIHSLSFLDFINLIFSPLNSIFNPEKTFLQEKDMDQPLTDYFINSSHNTYLLSNQLTGSSSTEAFVAAINKGCRCLEIDCWDGEGGDPIVTHGHTLTTKIFFKDVLTTIRDNAFKTSKYPLILSLEMHCSYKQQEKIGLYLQEVLEDKLYILPKNAASAKCLPTPKQLQYKILVKCKGSSKEDDNENEEDEDDEEEPIKNIQSEAKASIIKQETQQQQQLVNLGTNQSETKRDSQREQNQNEKKSQQELVNNNNNQNSVELIKQQSEQKKVQIMEQKQYSKENMEDGSNNNNNKVLQELNMKQKEEARQKRREERIRRKKEKFKNFQYGDEDVNVIEDETAENTYSIIKENNLLKLDKECIFSRKNLTKIQNHKENTVISFKKEDIQIDVEGVIFNGTDGTIDFKLDESEKHELEQNNFASEQDQNMQTYLKTEEKIDKKSKITQIMETEQEVDNDKIIDESIKSSLIVSENEEELKEEEDDFKPPSSEQIQLSSSIRNNNTNNNKQNNDANLQNNTMNIIKEESEGQQSQYNGESQWKFKNDPNQFTQKKSINLEGIASGAGGMKSLVKSDQQINSIGTRHKIETEIRKIHPELEKCIAIFGEKYKLRDLSSILSMCSIGERRALRYLKSNFGSILKLAQKFMVRIYPGAFRVKSTNFDPTKFWCWGAQMAALNFQTSDEGMLLNYAKFLQNGGINSGYILKPQYLRGDPTESLNNYELVKPLYYLQLQIISGQQLRYTQDNRNQGQNIKDVVDPYVCISIKGHPKDEESNKIYKTEVVKDNGLNPVFNFHCEFKVYCPEHAFLKFEVYDKDVMTSEMLGRYAVPFECIRPGYRVVPLLDHTLNLIRHCYLFVKVHVVRLNIESLNTFQIQKVDIEKKVNKKVSDFDDINEFKLLSTPTNHHNSKIIKQNQIQT